MSRKANVFLLSLVAEKKNSSDFGKLFLQPNDPFNEKKIDRMFWPFVVPRLLVVATGPAFMYM